MRTEVAIVGGGLAGSIAAITLARAGRDVVLMERENAPQHKVCGEFLSQEALDLLRSVGLDPSRFGAEAIYNVRLAQGKNFRSCSLPFRALSLTRKRLDEELLRVAATAGVQVLRGEMVQSVVADGSEFRVATQSGISVLSGNVFIATGKHDLIGDARPMGKQSGMVGFKMYFQLTRSEAAELAGHVELLLYRGGYGGLQPVEDGAANLCCLIHREELKRLGGRWEPLLATMQNDCAHLRKRLKGAIPLLQKPLAISSIPYGYVRECTSPGIWRLGDQAVVIPSFTGDGMSIALHSGMLAARMYLEGATAPIFQENLSGQVGHQVAFATALARGLVWRPSRTLMVASVAAFPGILSQIASLTRIARYFRLV